MVSLISYSQISSYNDLGVLFSRDNNRGTARFNALSGAFGALGGDISSTDINPAGAGIAKKSSLSVTLNNQNSDFTTNFTGNSFNSSNNKTNLSQVGGILSFDSAYNSKWNRFAMFFNYNLDTKFTKAYTAEGFSTPLYSTHFSDNTTEGTFDLNLYQNIAKETNLRKGVFNLGFSSVYENKLHLGASLKIHNLDFNEVTIYEEENDDIDGNILYTELYDENYISATGVSLNLGFIYKLNDNIRFGLAYETPTWYEEVVQDYYNELYMGAIEELDIDSYLSIDEVPQNNPFVFSYQSVSKLTASGAYIFGKSGLISIDYTHRNYKGINFDNADFSIENESFNNDYRNTYSLKVGTEWRFDKMSLRGGVRYEKDPNLIVGGGVNDDNIKSFSLGLGYNFGKTQFDLSYNNSASTEFSSVSNTGDLSLDNNTTQISGTLTINL